MIVWVCYLGVGKRGVWREIALWLWPWRKMMITCGTFKGFNPFFFSRNPFWPCVFSQGWVSLHDGAGWIEALAIRVHQRPLVFFMVIEGVLRFCGDSRGVAKFRRNLPNWWIRCPGNLVETWGICHYPSFSRQKKQPKNPDILGFPEIGVPPVIIHFTGIF